MPIIKNRSEFDGLAVNTVIDRKFKTNAINVRLLTTYDPNKAAAYAIIPQILTSVNADYPDNRMLSRRLNALYGAWLGGYSRQRGKIYEISMSVSYLCDRFALDGEKVSEQAAKLLLDCIFKPALEGDGFLKSEFNTKKINLLNNIDGEINDKLGYAMNHAFSIAYRGETSAERYFGTREDVEALTPEFAYEVYKELIKTARVELTFCGGGDFEGIIPMFTEAFSGSADRERTPDYYYPSPCKEKPEYREMKFEVQQANLILVFKTNGADRLAMTVLSWLYGETPFSKLFVNVRERLNICYFCSSAFIDTKDVLYVVSGIAPENAEIAKDEIIRQLDEIKAGSFSDEDIEAVMLALQNTYNSVGDRVGRLDDWYYTQSLKGSDDTPDDRMRKLREVTRDDVIAAANKIKLDTVFLLTDLDG